MLRAPGSRFANQLYRTFIKTDDGSIDGWWLCVQLDHVLHARHEIAVYFGNAPHLVLPRLELFFVQATTDGFLSNLFMMGQPHHLIGQ